MALVTSTEVLRRVYEGSCVIGTFDVNDVEIVQGITEAVAKLKSPTTLQVSTGARKYANSIYLAKLIEAVMELHPEIPIVLYPDHGADFVTCKDRIDDGSASVMVDYSDHSFKKNITETRKVVECTYAHGVVVEAELGTPAGVEDDVRVEEGMSSYARLEEVEEFMSRTSCDSLVIAIGTNHGVYKFKPGTGSQLYLDILEKVKKRLPGFPIVLHGVSSTPQEYVKIINANGGRLKDAIGVPEDQPREAARSMVYKINIDSDLCLDMTVGICQHFNEYLDHPDPRQYLSGGRANIKATIAHKTMGVLGSNNRI